jgi:hypothetical protein
MERDFREDLSAATRPRLVGIATALTLLLAQVVEDRAVGPSAAGACRVTRLHECLQAADEVRLLVTAPPAAAEAVPDLLAELTGRHP